MNLVKFPAFNLELKFSQIAFHLFGIPIYKYAVCVVIGILVALILARISKEKFGNKFEDILELSLYAIIAGIIGARIYFVIFNLKYYLSSLLQILKFRDGGLAIYGGLITGIIVVLIYCKIKNIKLLNCLDYIVPFVAIAQSIGRWGNFFNVEAYGKITTFVFRMGIESSNGYIEVHPVFLYESILTFLIFLFLRHKQKTRKFEGEIFLEYLMLYSFVRFFLEEVRSDSLMLFNFRISQILSVFIFIISLIFFIKNTKIMTKKCNIINNEKE